MAHCGKITALMKRLLLAVSFVALLAGCPGGGQGGSTPAAPTAGLPVVGDVYVFKLYAGTVAGAGREDEVVAVGSSTVTVERSMTLGQTKKGTEKHDEPLAGPGPTATIKPDMTSKVTGQETLTVSGRAFPCEVREMVVGKTTIKEWQSPHWPHVLRTTSGPFVTVELVQIRAKGEKE